MKAAVIFYHSNLHLHYPLRWIKKCVDSIAAQTYQDFDVIELNYGDAALVDQTQIGGLSTIAAEPLFYANIPGKNHYKVHQKMENHIMAMNHLLNHCFNDCGYDAVFNINMDDHYHPTRFEKQVEKIKEGYDLVSSDFCYVEERITEPAAPSYKPEPKAIGNGAQAPPTFTWPEPGGEKQLSDDHYFDQITVHMNICRHGDIAANLAKNHNIIAHPVVAYSKTFWTDGVKYPNILGKEDLLLWQQAIKMNKKIFIIDDELLFYRIHAKQVGKEYKV